MADFIDESWQHGWPSFRDEEVVWENEPLIARWRSCVRGWDIFGDRKGPRYCIDLLCISGNPTGNETMDTIYSKVLEVMNDNANNLSAKPKGISEGVIFVRMICAIVGLVLFALSRKKYVDRELNADKPTLSPLRVI